MLSELKIWQKRFEREKEIRKEAERLLEVKSLELYHLNHELQVSIEEYQQTNEELNSMLEFVNYQKEIIALKNDAIKKSIDAALRIQQATIPTEEELSVIFTDAFFLNIPKDTVSGDFLWLHEEGEYKIIVLADCTGHGVPGAFMSLIGNALLNKIVIDNHIFYPNFILDSLNTSLTDFFRRSNNTLHEGMDMTVLVYHSTTKMIKFAGAKNSLFYVEKDSIFEIKGDKKSIGGKHGDKAIEPFNLHEFQMREEMFFYFCTDGFQDQFGGEYEKKFMKKKLTALLAQIYKLPAEEQKNKLLAIFNQWRGENNQIDDVSILGFSFS